MRLPIIKGKDGIVANPDACLQWLVCVITPTHGVRERHGACCRLHIAAMQVLVIGYLLRWN